MAAGDFKSPSLYGPIIRGWLTGGSEFVEPTELTPERRRRLEWVASWRGTYDWKVPE